MENNTNKNNDMWMWIAGIIVLALVAWMIVGNSKDDADEVNDIDDSEQIGDVPSRNDVAGVEDITEGSVNKGAPAATISYTDAVSKYAATRFQLNTVCQATPTQLTVKKGTVVMIDNRSAETRSIKLGSTFTIKPWGFKLISPAVGNWQIDCGVNQNVAQVNVQA